MRFDLARSAAASLLLLQVLACGEKPPGDGSTLPTIYWKVQQVGTHAVDPSFTPTNFGFLRLFDDGRVLSLIEQPPTRHIVAMIRSKEGVWKEIQPPPAEAGLDVTWYDDDANYGGRFLNAPSHGFAMVNNAPHRFFGPPASVRGKLPDGTLAIDSNVNGYIFLQKWAFGPTSDDNLDILNYYHQDFSKSRAVTRLAQNGNVFLTGYDTATSFAADPVVVNSDQSVYDPAVNTDFGLVTMDRTQGNLFGLKQGIPTVRSAAGDESVGIGGWPVALNGSGDLLYIAYGDTGKEFNVLKPRFRWKGVTYQFSPEAWTAPSGASVVTYGLPATFDMNEMGQILFIGRAPDGASQWGRNLYVATPSTDPIEAPKAIDIQWTVKSGPGTPPDPMSTEAAQAVSGSFSASNLTLTATMQNSDVNKQRAISVFMTSSSNAFVVDQSIPVTGGVGIIGSTAYHDNNTAQSFGAISGNLRVTDATEFGGFTVHFENVAFRDTTSNSVFVANGTVVVNP